MGASVVILEPLAGALRAQHVPAVQLDQLQPDFEITRAFDALASQVRLPGFKMLELFVSALCEAFEVRTKYSIKQ